MRLDIRLERWDSISACPICRNNIFIAIGEVQQRPAKSGRLEKVFVASMAFATKGRNISVSLD
jgi:hypothetical protein